MQIALGDGTGVVKVPHRSQFDASAVKRQLGIAVSSWDAFMVRTKALAERKVTESAAEAFFRRVLTYPATNQTDRTALAVNERAVKAVGELYAGQGKGARLPVTGKRVCRNTCNCRCSTSWRSLASELRMWPCCCAASNSRSTESIGTTI